MNKIEDVSKLHDQVTQTSLPPTKVALEHHSQVTPMVIWTFLYEQLKEEEKA